MNIIQRKYVSNFVLFGLLNASIQAIMSWGDNSILGFSIVFVISGLGMSLFMVGIEKKALQKLGVRKFTEEAFDETQIRRLKTKMTIQEFNFLMAHNDKYLVKESNGLEYKLKRKYYTSEFERPVKISFIESDPPYLKIENTPFSLLYNDLGKAHQSVDELMRFIQTSELKEEDELV